MNYKTGTIVMQEKNKHAKDREARYDFILLNSKAAPAVVPLTLLLR